MLLIGGQLPFREGGGESRDSTQTLGCDSAIFSTQLGFVLVIRQRGKSLEGHVAGFARPGLEGKGWGDTALPLPSFGRKSATWMNLPALEASRTPAVWPIGGGSRFAERVAAFNTDPLLFVRLPFVPSAVLNTKLSRNKCFQEYPYK